MLREEKYCWSSKLAYFFYASVDILFFFMRGAGLCQYRSTRDLNKLDPDLCPYTIYLILYYYILYYIIISYTILLYLILYYIV